MDLNPEIFSSHKFLVKEYFGYLTYKLYIFGFREYFGLVTHNPYKPYMDIYTHTYSLIPTHTQTHLYLPIYTQTKKNSIELRS